MRSSTETDEATREDQDGEPLTKRRLRSSTSGEKQVQPLPGRSHVLPIQCIICRGSKYTKDKVTHKRRIERLVNCETKQGGKLLKAAKIRQDERLLLDISDRDLVAIEARYHRTCYLKYTKVARQYQSNSDSETSQQDYQMTFQKFSQVIIKERLIEGKEILRLTKLNKMFIKMVKEVEGLACQWHLCMLAVTFFALHNLSHVSMVTQYHHKPLSHVPFFCPTMVATSFH